MKTKRTAATDDVTCTCTGDQLIEHTATRRETNLFVVTTWTCDRCSGEVFAGWVLKVA